MADHPCISGGRSQIDLDPYQHGTDHLDSHNIQTPDNKESIKPLMHDDQNSVVSTCPSESESKCMAAKYRDRIEKAIYDEENKCLVVRTDEGKYFTHKYDSDLDSRYGMLHQVLHGTVYQVINQHRMIELFETDRNVISDPQHQEGLNQIYISMEAEGIT